MKPKKYLMKMYLIRVLLKGDGFHPAPVDLENVTLSRELQVCFGFSPYYLLSH